MSIPNTIQTEGGKQEANITSKEKHTKSSI